MGATVQQQQPPSQMVAESVSLDTARAVGRRRARLAMLASRLLFGTLLLVLLMAPFEVGYPPLGRLLWTTYTNLESTLFLMGGAWVILLLVDPAARMRLIKLPLLLPMLALVAACVVSTFFGEYKSLATQYIYRLLMGMLVLAVAYEALRSRRRLLVGMGVFVGSATLAALAGLLEFVQWVNVQPWLKVFKPQPTTVGGLLRLSGTFEYANGAAAFLEMAFPILLSLILISSAFLFKVQGSRFKVTLAPSSAEPRALNLWVCVALYVALAAVTMALILTFSRAAWLGVLVALVIFSVAILLEVRRRKGSGPLPPGLLRSFGIAVAVMAVGGVYVYMTHPLLALRLLSENDSGWYNNTITPGAVPTLYAGDYFTVPVTIRNDGPMIWHADRAPVVNLSYHWRQPGNAEYIIFEGERSSLPRDIGPNESATVDALVLTPTKPGVYQLEWDLVQENVSWFYQKSKTRAESASLTVLPATGNTPIHKPPPSRYPPVSVSVIENADTSTVPRLQLWKAALAMFLDSPITGVGPDGFRNLYGKYANQATWNHNIYTNNTYIEMFTNLGLLGGFAFLWLVGLALWRSVRNLLKTRMSLVWVAGVGAIAALLAFLVHGFVDYFLFSTPLYIAFWFIMALNLCWSESLKSEVQSPKANVS